MNWSEQVRHFCGAYLRTMDPERAAEAAGCEDGFAMLGRKGARRRLELAFGRANDAVRLALRPGEADPAALDLSAVAEFKITDKGGVEVKLVDRVRALETLCRLLENSGGGGAEELYRALEDAAGQLEEEAYGG